MENLYDFTPVKRATKKPLSMNEKVIILNVYDALIHQMVSPAVEESVTVCAKMTGVGQSTIYRLLKERKCGNGTVNTPKISSGRRKTEIDEGLRNIIRRTVHNFFFRKEIPTLDKIHSALEQDPDIPPISRTKLWKVLHDLNFTWEKHNRKSVLIDKEEIICWRRNYLRAIKKYRTEKRSIFYLDETWVNEGYTVQKVWTDKNIKNSRQAYLEGLSTGFQAPSGKGRRTIITHIGSEGGFLNGGLLTFQSKSTGDYHEDMNADVFEEYFEQMLDLIPPGSVIVLDNASYHSRQVEMTPTTTWRKADIIRWLSLKNIHFEENMVKKELLAIVNFHKPEHKKYAIDEMAKKRGVTILRLPPYHCELNPIELIWAQVKSEVARKNTTFKLKDVEILLNNAIQSVTSQNWKNSIDHVIKEEEKMWELDHLIDTVIDPIIVNLSAEDESSEDEL